MKFYSTGVVWLVLTIGLLIWVGSTAAETDGSAPPVAAEEQIDSAPGDLPDLISMATDLAHRSVVLEKEIAALHELSAPQKSLAQLAKETEKLSRNLNSLKETESYGYDQLFDVKAQIDQIAATLQTLIQATNEAIHQAESWSREWAEEGTRWEQLEASLPQQLSARTLEPTFAQVRQTIARSQNLLTQALEPLLSQLQAAEVIRASQASLQLELDGLISVLRGNLMHKTARSMFSAKYYFLLKSGLWKELPQSLRNLALPDLQYVEQRSWLICSQIFFSLVLGMGIFRRRDRLLKTEQWGFLARRPFAAGLFIAAITASFFYGAIPGAWRLLAQSVAIFSLARLMGAFFAPDYRKSWLVYGLSVLLIATRLFDVFGLPFSLLRLYIFATALIGLLLCRWRAKASARRGEALLYTRALRLGALLCLVILMAEMGGYSALSAHLLESSLKTMLIVLAGWMLMVMLRGFLEWVIYSPPLKRFPFLQVKQDLIVSRSALLTNLLAATLSWTFILVAWRVYSGPAEAIQAVWSFGVTLGSRQITLGLVLTAAALLYCAFFISWAVQVMLMEGLFSKRQLQVGVRISMARLVHYGFVLLGFLLALLTLGVELRDLTIIAGALGVGIGFGLQGIVNNFVAGLILLFERPIKVGDCIELGEQRAEVKMIGLRATVVQTPDRSDIVVPNSDLISSQVTNWTLSDEYAGIRIPVRVAYGSDVSRVLQALLECAQEHPQVVEHPAAKAFFMGFGESSLRFELLGWISEIDHTLRIKSELNQEIVRKFASLQIQIPIPQQDLHLHMAEKTALSLNC